MNVDDARSTFPARRDVKGHAALITAYREGLGLAQILVMCGPRGARSVAIADAGKPVEAEIIIEARWWCRGVRDAEHVAFAATARLKRLKSRNGREAAPVTLESALQAMAVAAKRLNIALYSDEGICAEAERIIVRVDEEFERLARAGELKSVNQSYRTLRLQASARGEKVPSYAQWINKYRQNLLRQLAAALR